jgi:PcfJ-like protein
MGKKLKLREARRRDVERAVCALLEAHSKRDLGPRAVERYDHFRAEYHNKIKALRGYALRAPEDWRCRIKSRSEERRFIDLLRFSFARYRVAAHLENAWIEEFTDDLVDRIGELPGTPATRWDRPDLRRWYLVAAQGGSLYKQYTSAYLTKLETHHFLTAPDDVTSSQQALWYAVARAQTDRCEIARRIGQSQLVRHSIASAWWKEVARFFARNPVPLHEMNDLIDYLRVAKTEIAGMSLKGRSLQALQRRREEWHRALRKHNAIGGGSWAGRLIPDVDYEAGSEKKKAIWRFRQIKTGNELFREGQRMHHCVASYKHLCLNDQVSIWSLTSEFPLGHFNRGVTIEVRKDGAIVQCRGFANRLPYGNEVAVVKRWANEYGLCWAAIER